MKRSVSNLYISFSIKFGLLSLLFLTTSSFLNRKVSDLFIPEKIVSPIELVDSTWVDSLMETLTMKQKVAQLFMVAAYSNKNESYNKSLEKLISEQSIGGVIFMQGSPHRQVNLNNRLQAVSDIPLMIGFDGEWGLNMRLDSTINYPRAMTLGAIQNDQLIFDMGVEIGRQCRRMGIHINFAPVIDVNSNPQNPIINSRSFGEDKRNVARKGLAYAMGLQSQQVLAVGKHFPGHGDTHSDSHHTLPVISHSIERLKEVELFPFDALFNNGLSGVMVAHMSLPNIIKEKGVPSSLSSDIVNDLLKTEMGFKGLVFTDALNMKGVTRDFETGEIEIRALLAGNDVLLFPANMEMAIEKVNQAVIEGRIPEELINERCYKILKSKAWLGLTQQTLVNENNLTEDIGAPSAYRIKDELIEGSITVCNAKGVLPISDLKGKKIASVIVQSDQGFVFNETLNLYAKVDTFRFSADASMSEWLAFEDTLAAYDMVLISQYQTSGSARRKYGLKDNQASIIESLSRHKGAVFVLFGNPYVLAHLKFEKDLPCVVAYENESQFQFIAAQSIFGARAFNGKMPVSGGDLLAVGSGDSFEHPYRLSYNEPCAFALNNDAFFCIDSMIQRAIEIGATPGCQVLFAKEGKVIYNKTFGHHTYNQNRKVGFNDVYDIASVTKVAASTLTLMKMTDDNLIHPSDKLSKYLPELKKTDKKNVRIKEFLSHQAGFHSWIPFYRRTLDEDGQLRKDLYKGEKEAGFEIKVLENLYLRNDFYDTVYQAVLDTPLYKTKKYRYSDLGYYYVPKLVSVSCDLSLDEYVQQNFYKSLGMNRTAYNPLNEFSYPDIIPSEYDNDYRHSIIHGFVNDQGAAMLGGVSGHAGLFSNANDLAKMSQMLLNGGVYADVKYLSEKTIAEFNKTHYGRKKNRRGLGFDKPALKHGDPGPTCESASPESFGHSGFTGAYMWVDPTNQSIYIFLSNRTFPDPKNKKLVKQNIRTDIQQAFYDVFRQ